MTASAPTVAFNGVAANTVAALAADLASGATTSRRLVEAALDRIQDPAGEGANAFLSVAADRAQATADGIDAIRAAGGVVPRFAGIPFAVKDLCDIEGEVTTAGSTVLADRAPAAANAPALERVTRAGFIVMGRTSMTEFAFSGLGLNSHFPAPASAWDRPTRRIPGGSSSGTGVAVADGMAVAGLGTDTGGSCRIPASFNGIVGFKPTARRVPLDNIVPLSSSLDSVGPLARSVECCAIVDDLFAGGDGSDVPDARPVGTLRLGVLRDFVLDGLDRPTAAGFEAALSRLSRAGVTVADVGFPELYELPSINGKGGLATAEAYHWHQQLLADRGEEYDQRVRVRIAAGAAMSASDYLDVVEARRRLIGLAAQRMAGFDAFVLPSVAIVPPSIESFDHPPDGQSMDDYYRVTNLLCLRNTAVGNFLDACSISVPSTPVGEAPVGFMLMGAPLADKALLGVARTVELLLAPERLA